MKDPSKTKQELVKELSVLKQKIDKLEKSETRRKQAEEALRENEARYRLLADNMTDAVWLMDMNLSVIYASPSVEKLIGYTDEQIKQMPKEKFLTPESLNKAMAVFSEEIVKAKADPSYSPIRTLELEFCRKDGTTYWGENTFSFIRDEKGILWSVLAEARDITERKQAEEERKQSFERMRKALRATVQAISITVEMKDPYTSGHQRRVADLARSIAKEMGLSEDRQDFIFTASTIHDIGKIAIPAEILSKPTKLIDLEFNLIKTHSQSGYDILKDIEFPWPVADVVLQHHERMDGSGYPQGLKGDDILLEARILAIADVVEAITFHRPYRPAIGINLALEEISRNKGILYDAEAVDACLKLFREKGYTLVLKK
jgi:PAS domain S-box-containing protein